MVYFFLYSDFRYNLYYNLAQEYKNKKKNVCFIVQDSKCIYKLKKTEFKNNILIFKCHISKNSCNQNDEHSELIKNTDVLSGNMGEKEALHLYDSMVRFIDNLKLNKDDIVFAGNGVHVQDLALKKQKKIYGYKTIFSELANIDEKIFLDPIGSNCHSLFYLMKKPGNFTNFDIQRWKAQYINKKMHNHIVRQANRQNLVERFQYYYFTLIDLLTRKPSYPALRIKSGNTKFKLIGRNKTHKSGDIPKIKYCESLPENYLFFALQVTNDAQILINSDYNNYEALQHYLKVAREKHLDLVVKLHPAERNIDFIREIEKQSINGEFYLSNENTFNLILNSKIVGVNNSTVGFESIICNKETYFLGKTFYSKLIHESWFSYYISSYLFNADFFSGEIFEENVIEKINQYFIEESRTEHTITDNIN